MFGGSLFFALRMEEVIVNLSFDKRDFSQQCATINCASRALMTGQTSVKHGSVRNKWDLAVTDASFMRAMDGVCWWFFRYVTEMDWKSTNRTYSKTGLGNLFTIGGRVNCTLYGGGPQNRYYPKIQLYLKLSGRVTSFELLSKYLLIMLIRFDGMVYSNAGHIKCSLEVHLARGP